MSNLKAEMTLGLNASGVESGIKSVNSNLGEAETSAKELNSSLDFDTSGIKNMERNLEGAEKKMKDVKQQAGFLGRSMNSIFQGVGMGLGMISFEGIKQGFFSSISLGLEFMQQSEEGQKRVVKWQEKIEKLKEGIGELFARAMEKMEPVIDWVLDAMENRVIPAFRDGAKFIYNAYVDYIHPFFVSIAEGWDKYGIPVVASFMTAWTNGLDIVKTSLVSWGLSCVETFEDVKYWFTDVIPGSVAWFVDAVTSNFTTMGENIKNIFSNVGKNISGFFQAIKDVASGKGWTFQAAGLTDGNKTLEVPAYSDYVQERQKTETEKSMAKNLRELGESINNGYEKNLAYLRKDIVPAVKQTAEATEKTADEFENVKFRQEAPEADDYVTGGGDDDRETKSEGSKSSLEDLVAAYTRIQMATVNVTPEEQELINIRRQNALQHQENLRLKREQHREMMKALAIGTQREAVVAGG